MKLLRNLLAAGLVAGLVYPTLAAGPTVVQGTTSIRTNQAQVNNTPLITLTAQGPGTVNSPVMGGTGKNLSCVYNQTALTGSSSITIAVQGVVPPGTGTIVTFPILTSAAVVANGASTLTVGPTVTASANVAAQAVVPALWRVQAVESGGGSTVTATVSCTTSD